MCMGEEVLTNVRCESETNLLTQELHNDKFPPLQAHCRPELTGGHFATNRFPRVLKEADIGHRVLCQTPISSGW